MREVPELAKVLGYAGLLPQAACLLAVFKGGPAAWTALALSYAYAALILSFLGGVWWGQAVAAARAPGWVWPVAVLPSLIGLGGWFPWTVGLAWPRPELFVIGAGLALSPLVDVALGRALRKAPPAGWMALRRNLSLGLGGLTLTIAALA